MPLRNRQPRPTTSSRRGIVATLAAALLAAALLAAAAVPLHAQMAGPNEAPDPATLGDEFDRAGSLAQWQWFHAVEGWPDMVRRADVGESLAGHLTIVPHTSGWYADFHAPFLFKPVTGDFVATARVRSRGAATELPSQFWSLAGLMVREPRTVTPATWEARGENWLFITTGVADPVSQAVLETKSTVNGRSNLKLHASKAGWVELAVARVGPSFVLLSRHDGEPWVVRERVWRTDLPPTVQVGLNAYSDWYTAEPLHGDPLKFNTTVLKDGKPDLVFEVDWFRFRRPPALSRQQAAALTAHSVSNERVIELLGMDGR